MQQSKTRHSTTYFVTVNCVTEGLKFAQTTVNGAFQFPWQPFLPRTLSSFTMLMFFSVRKVIAQANYLWLCTCLFRALCWKFFEQLLLTLPFSKLYIIHQNLHYSKPFLIIIFSCHLLRLVALLSFHGNCMAGS